ncbi:MAG: response regulator, partial [Candidatus Obscuribacterales bacterium]|nr:response regulator [Candidatus Obscuribacterales bacterium]
LKNLSLSLQYRVPAEYVMSDPVRIRQVLINLIGNAIKFSDQGEILIRVDNLGRQGRLRRVRFEVIDQGIGIEAERMRELFLPFVQIDGANTRKFGGTGLGLSISKKLVKLMGGEIGVESEVGKGSRFWFEIPLELAEDKLEVTAPLKMVTLDNWKPLANCRILLAEDHPINQMVAVSELEDGGAQVDLAADGEAACKACLEKEYDLILMDCQMPVMDGYEAAKQLRSKGFTLPILAMTASAMAGDRERCLQAGMTDYISKPFEKNELKEMVSRYFKQGKKDLPLLSNSNGTRNKSESSGLISGKFDFAAIESRYGKNWCKLLTAYALDLKQRLATMQTLLDKKEFVLLMKEAHTLVGASGLLFLRQLQESFVELELSCKVQDLAKAEKNLALANSLYTELNQQLEATADLLQGKD